MVKVKELTQKQRFVEAQSVTSRNRMRVADLVKRATSENAKTLADSSLD